MDNFWRRLFPERGDSDNQIDEEKRDGSGYGAGVRRDTKAYHQSLWRAGNIPAGVPRPRTEMRDVNGSQFNTVITTNILVAFLAAPGVGVSSFVNRIRFGDMRCTWPKGVHGAVAPLQYLCDGSVYNMGLAELPYAGFRTGALAVDTDRMAVVIAYAVDSPASFAAAQRLQGRLFRETHRPAAPPFPVMLLGLKSDLRLGGQGRGQNGGDGDLGNGPSISDEIAIVGDNAALEKWAFAWSRNMLHAEASAKTGAGVVEAMATLVEEVELARKADNDPERTRIDMKEFWIPAVALIAETADPD